LPQDKTFFYFTKLYRQCRLVVLKKLAKFRLKKIYFCKKKNVIGVIISLFRDGNLYSTEFAQTWDDGSYYIESIPIGNYEVKAEYFGGSFGRVKKAITYGTVKQEIEIKKDEELEFNLQLEDTNN